MDSSGKVLRKTEGSIKQSGLMKPSIHHENNNKDSQMGSSNSTGTALFLTIEEVNVFIEPKDNQAPQLTLHGELVVDEGGVEIISPEIISFNDTDTQAEQLTILILDFPQHGYLEIRDDEKGTVLLDPTGIGRKSNNRETSMNRYLKRCVRRKKYRHN